MAFPHPLSWHDSGNGQQREWMSDEDSFTGRVRRYAQVGTAMAGLGARLAGERYLGITVDRERHAAGLEAALGGIKGALMKGGARGYQGPVNEGGAAAPHDPRRAARGICPRADPAAVERAGDGLAVRAAP